MCSLVRSNPKQMLVSKANTANDANPGIFIRFLCLGSQMSPESRGDRTHSSQGCAEMRPLRHQAIQQACSAHSSV
jgi:hypothetical protein